MRWSPGPALALLLLLLFLTTAPPAGPEVVGGRVFDAHGPVAGATVRLQGTDVRTTTDAAGRFRLPRDAAARRVTASKGGYLISGKSLNGWPVDLRLRPLPADDHEDYAWVDPAPDAARRHNCGNCHGAIYREWAGSGHARAATGRHFRDLYEGTDARGKPGVGWGLLTQNPLGADVCASCHAPTAPAGALTPAAGPAGVHCDYCHKVSGVGAGAPGLTHGRDNLRLLRPAPGEQLFFGPLDDVDRGEDAHAPLYRDSRYCASCHEGVVFGTHVYGTYSEWLESPARQRGRQCQDCHMAPTGRMHNLAPGRGGLERDARTLANHRFFDGGRDDMLRRCVRVEASLGRDGGGVRAEVRVRAEGVGHRVPTGYIDRQLLLVVEGFDDTGRALAPVGDGPRLPAEAGAALAGKPGRLYAKVLRDDAGHRPAPFWGHDGNEPLDTRLRPGRVDRLGLAYPAGLARLRVRVLYRRFWDEVIRDKGWADRDVTVFDETFRAPSP